eukprot:scaffold22131_cov30-Tisochrysis_lutea.AAC.5
MPAGAGAYLQAVAKAAAPEPSSVIVVAFIAKFLIYPKILLHISVFIKIEALPVIPQGLGLDFVCQCARSGVWPLAA